MKPELIYVLVRMQDRGYFEVGKDEQLMGRLEKAVAVMAEPELKESAEENLAWLRNPGDRPRVRIRILV